MSIFSWLREVLRNILWKNRVQFQSERALDLNLVDASDEETDIHYSFV